MTNKEAKIHLQSAKLMLLGADGQPVSDLYYAVKKGIKALDQADVLQEIKKEIELKEKTLTDKYGQTKYGVWTDDVCNVFDKYIEKYSNT